MRDCQVFCAPCELFIETSRVDHLCAMYVMRKEIEPSVLQIIHKKVGNYACAVYASTERYTVHSHDGAAALPNKITGKLIDIYVHTHVRTRKYTRVSQILPLGVDILLDYRLSRYNCV